MDVHKYIAYPNPNPNPNENTMHPWTSTDCPRIVCGIPTHVYVTYTDRNNSNDDSVLMATVTVRPSLHVSTHYSVMSKTPFANVRKIHYLRSLKGTEDSRNTPSALLQPTPAIEYSITAWLSVMNIVPIINI